MWEIQIQRTITEETLEQNIQIQIRPSLLLEGVSVEIRTFRVEDCGISICLR